jgi:hypothetical protein
VKINVASFRDWGLGIRDWELFSSHQSPVTSPLSRQVTFNYPHLLNNRIFSPKIGIGDNLGKGAIAHPSSIHIAIAQPYPPFKSNQRYISSREITQSLGLQIGDRTVTQLQLRSHRLSKLFWYSWRLGG